MINQFVKTENLIINVFDHSTPLWHKTRAECLLDHDNWLRSNYMPDKCCVEEHEIFYIAFTHDEQPINFGGIMLYSDNVARAFNRMYTFPKFRSLRKLNENQRLLAQEILPICEQYMKNSFDCMFISMQQRPKPYAGEQKWWKAWKQNWLEHAPDWQPHSSLVSVCNHENKDCYQNVVYRANDQGYKDWNPKTLSYEDYHNKFMVDH